MVPRSEIEKLAAAWRALFGEGDRAGSRLIPIASGKVWRVLAGRQFPANEEVLFVGFANTQLPAEKDLPQGKGFSVCRVRSLALDSDFQWLSVVRSPGSNVDFFTMMAGDVTGILNQTGHVLGGPRTATLFLQRVTAWQEFMAREGATRLGSEAEIGLFGELVTLRSIVDAGVPPAQTVSAWAGPIVLHDFTFAAASLEVKTTLMKERFPAHVFCLEQLDDIPGRQLYVVAVRLCETGSGMTLIEFARALRDRLAPWPEAQALFGTRLMVGGLNEADADDYVRRFAVSSMSAIPVDSVFPRLARSTTRSEILSARYEVDLTNVESAGVGIADIVAMLGVTA
jgi:hypothetical protein